MGGSFLKCLVFTLLCFHWKHWNLKQKVFTGTGAMCSGKSQDNEDFDHLRFCCTLRKFPF